MKRKKIIKYKFKIIHIISLLAVLALAGGIFVFGGYSTVEKNTIFNITRGQSVSAVTNNLIKQGLIDSPDLFKLSVRAHGGKIQMGKYNVPKGASIWVMAQMFATGDVATTTVIIPEGLTVRQIKKLLLADSSLTGSVECSAGKKDAVCNLIDGELFPDTYTIADGMSRLAVLELSRKKMELVRNAWEKTGSLAPVPLKSWDEVVALASIVQKETPRTSEMPVVAGVYLNRLNSGMRLQADPTVVYALTDKLGDMNGAPLLRSHLKIDGPYNTYTRAGLPAGPIANVGLDALRAVLHPAKTDYLFFVADGKGGHNFAKTYAEHQKNHEKWRQIKSK